MQMTKLQKAILAVLFVLACLFLGRAAIFQAIPSMVPEHYAVGTDRMPYQGRFLMVPFTRFLLHAGFLDRVHLAEMNRVEIGFSFLNGLCLMGIGSLSLHLGRVLGLTRRLYYLPCILTLVTLAFTYCIHQEWNLYLLYDFPAYLLFGLGFWAIVTKRMWAYVGISLVGMINKETMLLLIPIWVAWQLREESWSVSALLGLLRRRWKVFGLAVLLAVMLEAEKYFAIRLMHYDRTAVMYDPPWGFRDLGYLRPWHFPQVFSAIGYSIPVVYLFRRLLSRSLWCVLMALVPGFCVLFYAGVPMENRVYGEFCLVVSLLLSFEFQGYLAIGDSDATKVQAVGAS